jgi:hypothetical protein
MLVTVWVRDEVKHARRPGDPVAVGGDAGLGGVGRRRLLGEEADEGAVRRRLLEAGRRCVVGPRGGCVLGSDVMGTGGVHEMRNMRKSCQKRVASSGDRVSWVSNRVWSWARRGGGRTGKAVVVICVEGAKDGADEGGWYVNVVVNHVGKDGVEEAARVGGATVSSKEDDVADGEGGERGVVVRDDLRTRRKGNGGGRGGGVAHVIMGGGRNKGCVAK